VGVMRGASCSNPRMDLPKVLMSGHTQQASPPPSRPPGHIQLCSAPMQGCSPVDLDARVDGLAVEQQRLIRILPPVATVVGSKHPRVRAATPACCGRAPDGVQRGECGCTAGPGVLFLNLAQGFGA